MAIYINSKGVRINLDPENKAQVERAKKAGYAPLKKAEKPTPVTDEERSDDVQG